MPLYAGGGGPSKLTVGIPDCARRITVADLRDITELILDDNAHMRELMKVTLSDFGMRHIYEAADGAAAMAKLDLGDVDIAFVDLKHGSMAHLGGIEFCREVRKRPETEIRHLPLIVVTAYSELRYLKQAVDAGADEFLAKPVSAAAIARRINAVVEHRRPFIRTPDFFGPDRRRRRDNKFKGPFRRSDDSSDVEI